MRAALALALLASCSPAQRVGALAATTTAMLVVDSAQTKINVGECGERNPVIGLCGENVPVGQYFAVAIAINLAMAVGLPERWRIPWLGAVGVVEATAIGNNLRYHHP